ncbi:MAG TPA: PepSY domain-containing protein [Steroidobacteraceae bacterium]|jgi:uncharacterized membrane protein YkoI|nr:PepSY domain-containing protein [Steroidobacteraceae bacterium]
MNKLIQKALLMMVLMTGLVISPVVFADAGVRVSMNDAIAMVQQRFNATAIKTDTVRDGDRVLYRIRLVSSDRSRVWTVTVDAQTGQVQ